VISYWQIFAVVAVAHLDHPQALPHLSGDLDVVQQDDIVGQEGDHVRAEAQVCGALDDLHGHQHENAGAGQRPDQAVQRLAKVGAEGRRKRQLESRQGVDDHPPGAGRLHRLADLKQRLIRRQIERSDVDNLQEALLLQPLQVNAEALRPPHIFERMLLKHRDHPGLALLCPRRDELRRQHRLPRARGAAHQHRVPDRNAAAQEIVQALDPRRGTAEGPRALKLGHRDARAREHPQASLADPEGM